MRVWPCICRTTSLTSCSWWKVKIKGESQEEETGSGLVPAAYVEQVRFHCVFCLQTCSHYSSQAPHTSIVKALYDYEANAPGELTIKEDDVLLVFGQEEAWLLVQAEGGNAGFVPENYTEVWSSCMQINTILNNCHRQLRVKTQHRLLHPPRS